MRRVNRFGGAGLCCLVLVLLAGMYCVAQPAAPLAADTQQQAPFSISQETTYLTEPLRSDGYVDYIQALNNSLQVPAENNAAIPFLEASGPEIIPAEHRQRYFELLGIDSLPATGPFLTGITQFADEQTKDTGAARNLIRDQILEEHARAMSQPWTNEQLPHLAEWLHMNERPLTKIVEGCRRPHCFFPLLPEGAEGMLVMVVLPQTQELREYARVLAARGMLRLGEGDVEGAWQDTLDCHRLSLLTGEGPTLLQRLISYAIGSMADRMTVAVAHSGRLTKERAMAALAELQALPPRADVVSAINRTERFMFLDSVASLTRKDRSSLQMLGLDMNHPLTAVLSQLLTNSVLNWDTVLKRGNEWIDRIVEALRHPTRAERMAAMSQLEAELHEIATNAGPGQFLKSLLSLRSPRATASEHLSHILVALLTPALEAASNAADRAAMTRQLAELSLALAAYHAEHGSYPARLEVLSPAYLKSIPEDIFLAAPLHYERDDQGYELYSVGVNGEDEGGRNYDDEPAGDDLSVSTGTP